jgi:hypothetical protein
MIALIVCAALLEAQTAAPPKASGAPDAGLSQLLTIERVYVERLNGGETAGQIRDMIISSLQNTRLFVITENPDRADAVLKGSAEDLVFTEVHSSSDSISAHANAGTGKTKSNERSQYSGFSVGENESTRSAERKHEAVASVRLVNKDGDVIWSTTQESQGAKFRGSSADVAEKVTRRLMEDYERARARSRLAKDDFGAGSTSDTQAQAGGQDEPKREEHKPK